MTMKRTMCQTRFASHQQLTTAEPSNHSNVHVECPVSPVVSEADGAMAYLLLYLMSYVVWPVQVENSSSVGKQSTTGLKMKWTNAVSLVQFVRNNAIWANASPYYITRGFICSVCV